MKFSTLEELKVRQWDVFGRLFESVRRQVGQNWPVQDFRGFIFSVPKTLPDNLIQRGVMALSERTHVLARLSPNSPGGRPTASRRLSPSAGNLPKMRRGRKSISSSGWTRASGNSIRVC